MMNRRTKVFGTVVLGLVLVRIGLPYFITAQINHRLQNLKEVTGHISAVHIHFLRRIFDIKDLTLMDKGLPLVSVEDLRFKIRILPLFSGHFVGSISLNDPVVHIEKKSGPPAKKPTVSLSERLKSVVPFKVTALKISNGEVYFRDRTQKKPFTLRATKIEVVGENLTNSKKVSESLYASVDIKAKLMESGDLQGSIHINPTQNPPQLKLSSQLKGLNLHRLSPALSAAKNIDIHKGSLDLMTQAETKGDSIEGYIEPIIHNLQIADFKKDKKKGLGHAIKQQVLDAAAAALKNQEKNQQATKIPFHGKFDNPKPDMWEAIVNVYKNIFVEALQPHFG